MTSGDHRFLTERGWKAVTNTTSGTQRAHLTTANKLMGTGAFARSVVLNDDYRRGYLCGMIRGDAYLGTGERPHTGGRVAKLHHFRLALCDQEALVRARNYLLDFEISTQGFLFQAAVGSRRAMHAISAQSFTRVQSIRGLISWPTLRQESGRRVSSPGYSTPRAASAKPSCAFRTRTPRSLVGSARACEHLTSHSSSNTSIAKTGNRWAS